MKKIVFILSLLACQSTVFAQLGVGTNSPDASAQLDVTASNKGFLAPRIALASATDVTTIASPASGLMIYNTATAGTSPNDVIPGYYYYDGTKWVRFINSQPAATISFNTTDPNSGSPTFSPNTTQNSGYIYVSSVNSSLWVWNGTSYVSYSAPSSTPFYLTGSTTDAGGNKTANIWRSGNVGIGTNNPSTSLEIATTGVGALIRRASTSLAASNLVFQKSASSDPAVNTALANGDYIGRILFSAGNGTNYPLNGTDIVGYAVGAQTTTNNGGGIFFRTVPQNSVAQSFERMRIEHNGFVGIGTTAPTTNLDVVGGFSLRNVTGAAGTNYGIEFNTNSSAPRIDWVFNGAYIGQFASDANDFQLRNSKLSTGGFRFYTNPAGTQVERMTILNNGNVGVNTSAPTSSLHVTGVVTQDVTSQDNFSNGINIRKRGNSSSLTGAAASGAEIGYHSFHGWNGTAYARGAYVIVSASENYTSTANGANYAIFTTANGTTSNVERLKIMHNGNIGIGTGNPNGALTLFGPSSLTLPTNIQGSTGATKELVFGRGGLTTGFAAITGVDNGQYGGGLSFVVKPTGTNDFPTNAIQAMVLDWNGNAGIGTNSPTQRLDVNGQVRIRTINSGAATDSLLVVNGGVIKSVAKSASVNTQTGNYILTSTDNGGILIMNAAAAVTVTVPATLLAGFVVQIIQKGAGQITVAGSGVTINSANGFKTRTLNSAIGVVMESATLGYITGDSNF